MSELENTQGCQNENDIVSYKLNNLKKEIQMMNTQSQNCNPPFTDVTNKFNNMSKVRNLQVDPHSKQGVPYELHQMSKSTKMLSNFCVDIDRSLTPTYTNDYSENCLRTSKRNSVQSTKFRGKDKRRMSESTQKGSKTSKQPKNSKTAIIKELKMELANVHAYYKKKLAAEEDRYHHTHSLFQTQADRIEELEQNIMQLNEQVKSKDNKIKDLKDKLTYKLSLDRHAADLKSNIADLQQF